MSEDEKIQEQKDVFWEIHLAATTVACMESKIDRRLDSMKKYIAAWEQGTMEATNDGRLFAGASGSPEMPPLEEGLPAAMVECLRERQRVVALKERFNRIAGVHGLG